MPQNDETHAVNDCLINIETNELDMTVNRHYRKLINPAITKKRKRKVFQTVNNSRLIWDPKAKPKAVLCGHLNIRSIKSKSDQVQHLLIESNLDFLCCLKPGYMNIHPQQFYQYQVIISIERTDWAQREGGL